MDSRNGDKPKPHGAYQLGGQMRLAAVCLDSKSAQDLADFAASTPLVRLQSEIDDYLTEDRDLPDRWTRSAQIDICVVDFDRDRGRARTTAEKIHAGLPQVAVFAVSSDSQPDRIIQAMRSGCSEYLLKPLTYEQLLQSIARVAARKKESQTSGQIIVFVGAKGGVGVTMLATHLGAILAKSHPGRTLLVDLHPAFGDAELHLGLLKYQYSFRDLAENAERLDSDLLQSFVLHHRSGLDLLPAPGAPQAGRAGPAAIGATLDFLRYCYEVLFVDCPPGLGEDAIEAIQRADFVCIVAVPEIAALRNVARCLDLLGRIKYPREKAGVVINRWTRKSTITDEQIEEAIHSKIFWKLPNQYYEVIRAINDGDPTARSSTSELSRSLSGFAAQIASKAGPSAEGGKASKGLLAILGR